MRQIALASAAVLLGVTACGSTKAVPVANVLVYAAPPGTQNFSDASETIWRARLDGSHPRRLATGEDPTVSPDGRWVAFGRGPLVLLMPTVGGSARRIYTLEGQDAALEGAPEWAPDSRHLAFFGNGGLVVFDLQTGTKTTLRAKVDDFDFSPDSSRIVYEEQGDLYVVRIGGGRRVRITDDRKSYGPVWGPAGIAFVRLALHGHGDIWLTHGRPGRARQLTHTRTGLWPADFSADGTKLLADYPPLNNGRIWAVDVKTGRARPLTPWRGDLRPQGLSRDGKTVLASIGCGGTPSPYGYLETLPFTGGKPHVIVQGPCRASWNAS